MTFKKRNKNITSRTVCISLVAMLITLFAAPQFSAHAESYGAFYVEANIQENQYDPNVGYFDLIMEPDMKQTISFDVVNQGNQPMRASIDYQNGTTSLNAEKSYIHDEIPDASMKHPMKSMAELKTNSVVIPAQQSAKIYIDITAPSIPFDGVSVGGFSITADTIEDTQKDAKNTKDEIQIGSRTTYLLALQIRMNETKVEKNLNYIKSDAKVMDFKPQFFSYIQNDKAVVMNDIKINGTVTPQGSSEPIAMIKKEIGGILPNTQFPIAYPVTSNKLNPGVYTIDLEITSGKDVWRWQEIYTVEDENAETINSEVYVPKHFSWVFFLLIGMLLLILILLAVIGYIRYKQHKERKSL